MRANNRRNINQTIGQKSDQLLDQRIYETNGLALNQTLIGQISELKLAQTLSQMNDKFLAKY